MKYNVGDRVQIKSIDWYNRNKDKNGYVDVGVLFDEEMSRWCGKTMTIIKVNQLYYTMEEDDISHFFWTDEMFEGHVEETTETTIKIKDLRKFINQMEIEGLNDETVLTFETKRSSEHIENITSMEYSPTTNILIFS